MTSATMNRATPNPYEWRVVQSRPDEFIAQQWVPGWLWGGSWNCLTRFVGMGDQVAKIIHPEYYRECHYRCGAT